MNKEDVLKQIGRNIKSLRIRKNMTREELAEKVNVTDRTIQNWEKGKSINTFDLYLLSDIFKCEINDFYIF